MTDHNEIKVGFNRILNYDANTQENHNIELQISLFTNNSKQIQTKTIQGIYSMQCLLLNTSFLIPSELKQIICHLLINSIVIQKLSINIHCGKQIQYIPCQHDNQLLQIAIQEKRKYNHTKKHQNYKSFNWEKYIAQKYKFLKKMEEHQSLMKQEFAEKVYCLLKNSKVKKNSHLCHNQWKNRPFIKYNKESIQKQQVYKKDLSIHKRIQSQKLKSLKQSDLKEQTRPKSDNSPDKVYQYTITSENQ